MPRLRGLLGMPELLLHLRHEGAIDHDMVERLEEVKVGSIILVAGLRGLRRCPVTRNTAWDVTPTWSMPFSSSASFLRPARPWAMSSAPPTARRPGRSPFSNAWAAATSKHPYCSAVCCMYATKEAIIAKEHDRAIEPTIFFIDMRAYGKGFDAYFERAEAEHGVRLRPLHDFQGGGRPSDERTSSSLTWTSQGRSRKRPSTSWSFRWA